MASGLGGDALPGTFRRTWSSRLVALAGLLGSSGLLLWLPTDASGVPLATWIVLGAFAALSGALLVRNFFDGYTLTGEGIVLSNPLLERLGWKSLRVLRWGDIVTVREPRRRVLFLLDRFGRRHVIDSIHGYDELCSRILQEVNGSGERPGVPSVSDGPSLPDPDFPGT